MAGTRQQIKTALLARLQAATFPSPVNGSSTWVSVSRRLKLWGAVDPSAQPALFLVQHKEEYRQVGVGTPGRIFLDMGAWCYANTGDETIVGDDLLDFMMKGIEGVLHPDDPQRNELTLGGLCSWCRIDMANGMFIRDPGDIDGQALLVVPIRILLPAEG